MGGSEIRIALQSLLELGERLGIAMRIHQRSGVIRIHDGRKRVERQGEAEFLERLIKSLFGNEEGKGVEIMRCGAIGGQFDCAAKLFLSLGPMQAKSKRISAGQMCLWQGVIQFERLAGCFVGKRSRLPGGYA